MSKWLVWRSRSSSLYLLFPLFCYFHILTVLYVSIDIQHIGVTAVYTGHTYLYSGYLNTPHCYSQYHFIMFDMVHKLNSLSKTLFPSCRV